jgi:PPOX class probable FMN-dependent enzyme
LLIPDRRGNNRADSLRNIIRDDRVALLFLIPGVGETLRVNGRASISIAPELIARFPYRNTLPRSVIVVRAERVYFQCSKALVRSELWNPDKQISRKALPSTGTILADITAGKVGGDQYDRDYPERLRSTIY